MLLLLLLHIAWMILLGFITQRLSKMLSFSLKTAGLCLNSERQKLRLSCTEMYQPFVIFLFRYEVIPFPLAFFSQFSFRLIYIAAFSLWQPWTPLCYCLGVCHCTFCSTVASNIFLFVMAHSCICLPVCQRPIDGDDFWKCAKTLVSCNDNNLAKLFSTWMWH